MIRLVKTKQERTMAQRDKEHVRAKRNSTNLPNSWDTQWITIPKSWKDRYKKRCQWEDAQVKTSYQNGTQMSSEELNDYSFREGEFCPKERIMDFDQAHVWADEEYAKEWRGGKSEEEVKWNLFHRLFGS
jgi:hypothetical protein